MVSSSTLEISEPRIDSEFKEHERNSYSVDEQTIINIGTLDERARDTEFGSDSEGKNDSEVISARIVVEDGVQQHGVDITLSEMLKSRSCGNKVINELHNSGGNLEVYKPSKEDDSNEDSALIQDGGISSYSLHGTSTDDIVDIESFEAPYQGAGSVFVEDPTSEGEQHDEWNVEDENDDGAEISAIEDVVSTQKDSQGASKECTTVSDKPEFKVPNEEAVKNELANSETVEMYSTSALEVCELGKQGEINETAGVEKSEVGASDLTQNS